tara:strand:- start:5987 stop:6325 length:339 start_codon:yes stop_codon:yes gene_type:complete
MIPKVKTWIVKRADGSRVEVLAPTKVLASLNYRQECLQGMHGGFAGRPVKSIFVKRKAKAIDEVTKAVDEAAAILREPGGREKLAAQTLLMQVCADIMAGEYDDKVKEIKRK